MKLRIIFCGLVFLIAMSLLGSCRKNESKPIVVGVEKIQNQEGVLLVEIDSLSYVPQYVLVKNCSFVGYECIPPVEKMVVTCFKTTNHGQVQFMVGENNEQQVERFFHKNYTLPIIIFLLFVIVALINCYEQVRSKKKAKQIE